MVLKVTQGLRVARQYGWARWCRGQHKACVSQSDVARHGGCRRQHKACVSQSDVARHDGAEGDTRLACRKAIWLGTMVPRAT
ncbi:unnamed protein product [Prunus armeniaca]